MQVYEVTDGLYKITTDYSKLDVNVVHTYVEGNRKFFVLWFI